MVMKKITRKTKLDALFLAQVWSMDYYLLTEVSCGEVRELLKVSSEADDLASALWREAMRERYPEKLRGIDWTDEELMQAYADVARQLQKELGLVPRGSAESKRKKP
jgi:hypothetical protein